MPHDLIAMDRDSVRSLTKDGYLVVSKSPISKANVCPYRGREIPGFDKLGLDPDKVYMLLRDPVELQKASSTSNLLPILSKHMPVTTEEFPEELIIGSTGTDGAFDGKYLTNSMSFWKDEGIAGVESDQKRELSWGYHYDPDMTPGEFQGARYDGVMRNMKGNHVAAVEDGRAGDDVMVMDAEGGFEESNVKRDAGGKFSANAAGASAGAAHHSAKAAEHRAAGRSANARPHERAAKAYGAAVEHHDAGRPAEAAASHKEAEAHGRQAAGREAKVEGGGQKEKPAEGAARGTGSEEAVEHHRQQSIAHSRARETAGTDANQRELHKVAAGKHSEAMTAHEDHKFRPNAELAEGLSAKAEEASKAANESKTAPGFGLEGGVRELRAGGGSFSEKGEAKPARKSDSPDAKIHSRAEELNRKRVEELRSGGGDKKMIAHHEEAADHHKEAAEHYSTGRDPEAHRSANAAMSAEQKAGRMAAKADPASAGMFTSSRGVFNANYPDYAHVASIEQKHGPGVENMIKGVEASGAHENFVKNMSGVLRKIHGEPEVEGGSFNEGEKAKPEAEVKPAKPDTSHVHEIARQLGIGKKNVETTPEGGGHVYGTLSGNAGYNAHSKLKGMGFEPKGEPERREHKTSSSRTAYSEQGYEHPEGHTATLKQENYARFDHAGRPHHTAPSYHLDAKIAPQGEGGSKFAQGDANALTASKLRNHLSAGGLNQVKYTTTAVKGWHNSHGDYHLQPGTDTHVLSPHTGHFNRDPGAAGAAKTKRMSEVLTKAGVNHTVHAPDPEAKRYGHEVHVPALQRPQAAGKDAAMAKDSQLEGTTMPTLKRVALSPRAAVVKGALIGYLTPLMAQDQAVPNFDKLLLKITAKNYDANKKALALGVAKLTSGKLAMDADMDDVHGFLDKFGGKKAPEMATAPAAEPPAKDGEGNALAGSVDPESTDSFVAEDDDLEEKIRELLQGKLDPQDLEMLLKLVRPEDAAAEPEPGGDTEVMAASPDEATMTGDGDPAMKPVTQPAMDAAIAKAVKQTEEKMQSKADAIRFVRPWVGDIVVAMDSAESVYKFALEKGGVETKGVHPSAFKAMLAMVPKPGDAPRSATPILGMDAAGVKSFTERYPDAARMRVIG